VAAAVFPFSGGRILFLPLIFLLAPGGLVGDRPRYGRSSRAAYCSLRRTRSRALDAGRGLSELSLATRCSNGWRRSPRARRVPQLSLRWLAQPRLWLRSQPPRPQPVAPRGEDGHLALHPPSLLQPWWAQHSAVAGDHRPGSSPCPSTTPTTGSIRVLKRAAAIIVILAAGCGALSRVRGVTGLRPLWTPKGGAGPPDNPRGVIRLPRARMPGRANLMP
jgi:hypothetical protein